MRPEKIILALVAFPWSLSLYAMGARDASSIALRTDGLYDVTCKDGTKEIACASEIDLGHICENRAPLSSSILSITDKPGSNEVYVLCSDNSWRTVPRDLLGTFNVCANAPLATNRLIGNWRLFPDWGCRNYNVPEANLFIGANGSGSIVSGSESFPINWMESGNLIRVEIYRNGGKSIYHGTIEYDGMKGSMTKVDTTTGRMNESGCWRAIRN